MAVAATDQSDAKDRLNTISVIIPAIARIVYNSLSRGWHGRSRPLVTITEEFHYGKHSVNGSALA